MYEYHLYHVFSKLIIKIVVISLMYVIREIGMRQYYKLHCST